MMKTKRKVTVDNAPDEGGRRKPSVFERLGPGAGRKSFGEYEDSDSDREGYVQKCRNWLLQGSCPYGSKCKFQHGPFSSGTKSKGKRDDDSSDDLRLRVKRRKDKGDKHAESDSDDSPEAKRSHSRGKKEKESRIKSAAVIVKKGGHGGGSDVDTSSTGHWSGEELDYKKELELEKKRQQIQKELLRLADEEDTDARENFTIQRQLASTETESEDEPRRGRSSTRKSAKSPTKKKGEKKKGKVSRSPTKTKQRTPSPKSQDRYDSEREEHPKIKHKKKGKGSGGKKRQDSLSDIDKTPEPDTKSRKLLSPLKFKKAKAQQPLSKITAFHSETDEDLPPPKQQKRSRSYSSEDDHIKPQKSHSEIPKGKNKQTLSPVKKKKAERKESPEVLHSKSHGKEAGKYKHAKGKSRSVSSSRERSSSPDGKKMKKFEKKKKAKREPSEERKKDISFERARTPEPLYSRDEGKMREDTPMSDYSKARDFSPDPEPVKKKKDKKKQKKINKDRESSVGRDDHEHKHKKQKDKNKEKERERERSESPAARYSQKQEKKNEPRGGYRKDVEPRGRSPPPRGSGRDQPQDRRGKSPEQSYRPAERSPGRHKDQDLGMYSRKEREIRERENREPREFDRDRERERDHEDYRRSGRPASPGDRGGRGPPGPAPQYRGEGQPLHGRDPGPMGHRGDYDRTDTQGGQDRRERYPDYREDRRERYDDQRYPPNFDERSRFERDRGGYDRDRGHWGRPEREGIDRDRYERDRYPPPPQQQDQRYDDGPNRGGGRQQYNYRDPGWDRNRGRGYGNQPQRGQGPPHSGWGRGGPQDRGRFEERSNRRSDWESNRRAADEFYVPERREWQDRRDDRRDMPRDDSRDGRRGDRQGPDRDLRRDDRDRRPDERRDDDRRDTRRLDDRGDDDRRIDRDRRDGSSIRRRDMDDSDDRSGKRDESVDDRQRDRLDDGRRPRNHSRERDEKDDERIFGDDKDDIRDEKRPSSRSRDQRSRSKDRKSRRRRDEDIDKESGIESRERDERLPGDEEKMNVEKESCDLSRKRPASISDTTSSPVTKRARDGSPAASTHSIGSSRSARDKELGGRERSRSENRREKIGSYEEEGEKHSDRVSEAASEKSHHTLPRSDSMSDRSCHSRGQSKRHNENEGHRSRSLERGRVERHSQSHNRKCSPKSHDGRLHFDDDKLPKSADKKRSRSLDAYDMEEDNKRRKTEEPVTVEDTQKDEKQTEEVDQKPERDSLSEIDDQESQQGKAMESIEQNFSDWSDDDSDLDILNQPEQSPPPVPVEPAREVQDDSRQKRSPSRSSLGSRHSHGSRSQRSGHRPRSGSYGNKERSQDGSGDLDLGGPAAEDGLLKVGEDDEFESISSEEEILDQANDAKPEAVDALALDWASLVKDDKPPPTVGSALLRFRGASVLSKIGVSRTYAGEELYREVITTCQRQQEEDNLESKPSGEEQSTEETTNETDIIKNKHSKFTFLHGVADFHASLKQKQMERKNLLGNLGPFRRSLCAYRDLEMRRQLCKVDKVLDHTQVYPTQELDSELCKESVRLFRQAGDRPDRHQSVTSSTAREITCP